jgi:hypothetical protein
LRLAADWRSQRSRQPPPKGDAVASLTAGPAVQRGVRR